MMEMILNWHNLEVKHGVIENIIFSIDFSSHRESNILVVLPRVAKKCSPEKTNYKQGTNLKSVESL